MRWWVGAWGAVCHAADRASKALAGLRQQTRKPAGQIDPANITGIFIGVDVQSGADFDVVSGFSGLSILVVVYERGRDEASATFYCSSWPEAMAQVDRITCGAVPSVNPARMS